MFDRLRGLPSTPWLSVVPTVGVEGRVTRAFVLVLLVFAIFMRPFVAWQGSGSQFRAAMGLANPRVGHGERQLFLDAPGSLGDTLMNDSGALSIVLGEFARDVQQFETSICLGALLHSASVLVVNGAPVEKLAGDCSALVVDPSAICSRGCDECLNVEDSSLAGFQRLLGVALSGLAFVYTCLQFRNLGVIANVGGLDVGQLVPYVSRLVTFSHGSSPSDLCLYGMRRGRGMSQAPAL